MVVMWLVATYLGCSSSAELTPESAAALADEIADDPAGAAAVLADAGTEIDAFETYLYAVAADAELTKRYLAARKR
jgi:hypothetical protein